MIEIGHDSEEYLKVLKQLKEQVEKGIVCKGSKPCHDCRFMIQALTNLDAYLDKWDKRLHEEQSS